MREIDGEYQKEILLGIHQQYLFLGVSTSLSELSFPNAECSGWRKFQLPAKPRAPHLRSEIRLKREGFHFVYAEGLGKVRMGNSNSHLQLVSLAPSLDSEGKDLHFLPKPELCISLYKLINRSNNTHEKGAEYPCTQLPWPWRWGQGPFYHNAR